jgi:uncharacterized protein
MMSELKARIQNDMKQFMRDKNSTSLATIRLILAAIKQVEVDKRIELNDSDIITILDKMMKQRQESIEQFLKAGRDDLADKESAERLLIQNYLPPALSSAEIQTIVSAAISETGASTIQDMGKVMAILKPQVQGRADMKQLSLRVREQLN